MKFDKLKLFVVFVLFICSFQSELNSFKNVKKIKRSKINRVMSKSKTMFKRRTHEFLSLNMFKKQQLIINSDIEITDYAAIEVNDDKYSITNEIPKTSNKVIAECRIKRQLKKKGWDKLSIFTYKQGGNAFIQSYFAGYLEGRMTAVEIEKFIKAKDLVNKKDKTWEKIENFFSNVNQNLIKKISTFNEDEDSNNLLVWSQLLLGYAQLKGLHDGYNFEAQRKNLKNVSIERLLLIQADGELPELKKAISYLSKSRNFDLKSPDYFKEAYGIDTKDPNFFWNQLMKQGRCSAFIKLTTDENGNAKDLLAGHTTWGESVEMIRIYKYHNFEFEDNDEIPHVSYLFSGYPGTLSSTDDFYTTNNKLVVTETTIEVVDVNKYSSILPEETYLPNYMRVLAATRFAKSGDQWVKLFQAYNSGTYSSQWLILDYNIFEKIKGTNEQMKGLFFILEQIPDKITVHDASKYLYEKGFFGSYNRAFFSESNESLNSALLKNLYGKILSDYDASRRGKQFQYLEKKVYGLKSLMDTMRYNGYKQNNFDGDSSNTSPSSGISARYDLTDKDKNFIGGIDAKITNYDLISKNSSIAINGPADERNNKNLKNYKLKKNIASILGMKQKIKYPYVLMNPNTIVEDDDDLYSFEDDK